VFIILEVLSFVSLLLHYLFRNFIKFPKSKVELADIKNPFSDGNTKLRAQDIGSKIRSDITMKRSGTYLVEYTAVNILSQGSAYVGPSLLTNVTTSILKQY